MAKQKILLEGKNIYRDKHNRAIYYVKREDRGYRIRQEYESTFQMLSMRYLVGVLVFIFAYLLFELNIVLSVALGLAATLFMQFKFKKFLGNCTIIEHYVPDAKENKSAISVETSYSSLIIRAILYVSCSILLVINAYNLYGARDDQTLLFVLSIVVAVVVLFFGLKYIEVIIKKHKLSKN